MPFAIYQIIYPTLSEFYYYIRAVLSASKNLCIISKLEHLTMHISPQVIFKYQE